MVFGGNIRDLIGDWCLLEANIWSKWEDISSVHTNDSIAAVKEIEFIIESSNEGELIDGCILEAVDIVLKSNNIDIITLGKIGLDSCLKTCKVIQDIDHAHLAELICEPVSEILLYPEALDEVKKISK